MKLLEVIGNCLRCGAGHLLTDDNVWDMCQCCFRISKLPHASHLMARMAEATLSHIVRGPWICRSQLAFECSGVLSSRVVSVSDRAFVVPFVPADHERVLSRQ